MVRTDTGRVVAVMANIKTFGDRTVGQFIRDTVSRAILSLPTESSVSLNGAKANPFPTTISLLDIRPKPFFKWLEVVGMVTGFATKLRKSGTHEIRRSTKLYTALLTGAKRALLLTDSVIARAATKLALLARLGMKSGTALDTNNGILGRHQSYSFGVTLPAVSAARGLCCAFIIPHSKAAYNYST